MPSKTLATRANGPLVMRHAAQMIRQAGADRRMLMPGTAVTLFTTSLAAMGWPQRPGEGSARAHAEELAEMFGHWLIEHSMQPEDEHPFAAAFLWSWSNLGIDMIEALEDAAIYFDHELNPATPVDEEETEAYARGLRDWLAGRRADFPPGAVLPSARTLAVAA